LEGINMNISAIRGYQQNKQQRQSFTKHTAIDEVFVIANCTKNNTCVGTNMPIKMPTPSTFFRAIFTELFGQSEVSQYRYYDGKGLKVTKAQYDELMLKWHSITL
jgi:hypothetical protein